MLILARSTGQDVHLTLKDGTVIVVRVLKAGSKHVRLGFDAPPLVRITRPEMKNQTPKLHLPPKYGIKLTE